MSDTAKHDDDLLRKVADRVRDERDEPELPEGVAPFDDAAADRMAERLLGEPAKPQAKVIRPARWQRLLAPLAVAAAVAIAFASRSSSDELPGYELSVSSAKALRADPAAAPAGEITLDPDGEIDLVARPSSDARGVAARAILVRDGVAKPWAAPLQVSSEGAIRVTGSTKSLFPETNGAYEIVVLLAQPARALPSEAQAVRIASGAEAPRAVRVVRARIRFASPT